MKTVELILCAALLDEQAMIFQITMKSNSEGAMMGDLPLNPLTRLWRCLEASGLLQHKLSEYLKVAELAVVAVLGSVEDERALLHEEQTEESIERALALGGRYARTRILHIDGLPF